MYKVEYGQVQYLSLFFKTFYVLAKKSSWHFCLLNLQQEISLYGQREIIDKILKYKILLNTIKQLID